MSACDLLHVTKSSFLVVVTIKSKPKIFTVAILVLLLSCQQDSSEIHFKVKMTTHLKKLKESYSQRQVPETGGGWLRMSLFYYQFAYNYY